MSKSDDVLTPREAAFVAALRDAPILSDGMDSSTCHDAARLIDRLVAEVARLRKQNSAGDAAKAIGEASRSAARPGSRAS